MITRMLCELSWVVHGPAYWQAERYHKLQMWFDGVGWLLTDGEHVERHGSRDEAACRAAQAVELARARQRLANSNQAQESTT